MAKLPKYSLSKNKNTSQWELKKDGTSEVTQTFATKSEGTQGGVLRKAVGEKGGSVRIKKEDGKIQEERTFPRSADPTKSPG